MNKKISQSMLFLFLMISLGQTLSAVPEEIEKAPVDKRVCTLVAVKTDLMTYGYEVKFGSETVFKGVMRESPSEKTLNEFDKKVATYFQEAVAQLAQLRQAGLCSDQ